MRLRKRSPSLLETAGWWIGCGAALYLVAAYWLVGDDPPQAKARPLPSRSAQAAVVASSPERGAPPLGARQRPSPAEERSR